ncbi:hypothetical protein TSAR_015541 [Trichomalopsis sarcophagae]|uniref:Uncharacterized protein n=1 Tax=Trichomalopsis sarcophagae TaxID=543379 RepID=A0A232EUC4_9HYME|nr:hypothetical protein TSAR_015541 [Trichomalopsis sarcophagae]
MTSILPTLGTSKPTPELILLPGQAHQAFGNEESQGSFDQKEKVELRFVPGYHRGLGSKASDGNPASDPQGVDHKNVKNLIFVEIEKIKRKK